jgi:hypothetical protein
MGLAALFLVLGGYVAAARARARRTKARVYWLAGYDREHPEVSGDEDVDAAARFVHQIIGSECGFHTLMPIDEDGTQHWQLDCEPAERQWFVVWPVPAEIA